MRKSNARHKLFKDFSNSLNLKMMVRRVYKACSTDSNMKIMIGEKTTKLTWVVLGPLCR